MRKMRPTRLFHERIIRKTRETIPPRNRIEREGGGGGGGGGVKERPLSTETSKCIYSYTPFKYMLSKAAKPLEASTLVERVADG